MSHSYAVRPLFDLVSCTWSYILYDIATNKAALIDSVIEHIERDLNLIEEMGLSLKYLIETHIHADHITAAGAIQDKMGGADEVKIILGAGASAVEGADMFLNDGEELMLGETKITALATPGHTNGCTSYAVEGAVFTGDALLIRGCGRTDFQEGSSDNLFDSVRNKIFAISESEEIRVYPAHDYKGMLHSTITEEKEYNPRLKITNTKEEFIKIMDNLNLPHPKLIDIAVPRNLKVGRK